jgi:hypothetical protein
MQRAYHFALTCLSVFVLGYFLCQSDVNSQEQDAFNLTISPVFLSITTDPGQKIEAQVKIKNGSNKLEELKIDLMKFSANDASGIPKITEVDENDEFVSWVNFPKKEFELAPNEWKSIQIEFDIPEEAALGYYYAVTFFPKNREGAKIIGAASIPILLEVNSPLARKELELIEFSISKKVYEFLPAQFDISVKNVGNVHVVPKGNVFIGKGQEKEVAILNVNQKEKGNVLPNSQRTFQSKWQDGFPIFINKIKDDKVVFDKDGNPKKKLDWKLGGTNSFRFGKYQADLLLIYDDGKRDIPIESSLEFWVIPWRLILISLAILVFVGVGFKTTMKIVIKKFFKRKG